VQKQSKSKRQMRGYSIVELLVSLGIITALSAIAVPSLVRTYLNNIQNGYLTMFTQDPTANANVNANERQIVLNGPGTLANSGAVPSSGALPAVVNVGALTTISPSNGTVTFDGRGAKTTPGVSVYWVGNTTYGWRAVTVMPSGAVQVWSYATGTWQQLN
jgi:hypothetical protein